MHRVPVYRNDSSISLSSSSNSVQLHPGEHALSTLNLSTLNESSLPTAQIFSALNLPRNYPSVSPDIFSCFYQTSAPSSSPPIQTIRSSSSIRNSSPLSTAKSEKKEKREPRISLSLSFSIFLSLSLLSLPLSLLHVRDMSVGSARTTGAKEAKWRVWLEQLWRNGSARLKVSAEISYPRFLLARPTEISSNDKRENTIALANTVRNG